MLLWWRGLFDGQRPVLIPSAVWPACATTTQVHRENGASQSTFSVSPRNHRFVVRRVYTSTQSRHDGTLIFGNEQL